MNERTARPPTPLVPLLLVVEVAEILRTTPRSVERLIKNNKLKASRPGRAWLVHPDDLQRFLDNTTNRSKRGLKDEEGA